MRKDSKKIKLENLKLKSFKTGLKSQTKGGTDPLSTLSTIYQTPDSISTL